MDRLRAFPPNRLAPCFPATSDRRSQRPGYDNVAIMRGHDLGTIGVVLPPGREVPDAATIRARIGAFFDAPSPQPESRH